MAAAEEAFPGLIPPTGVTGSELTPMEQSLNISSEAVTDASETRRRFVGAKAMATMIEILPVTNEGLRYGALAAMQGFSHSPVLGAAVLGATTFAVEAGGAVAASEWIADGTVNRIIDRVDTKVRDTKLAFLSPKRVLPEGMRVTPLAEAGVALTLGTVAVLEAKQREDPSRSLEQNRRHALFTAGWMSGLFAAEGALLSEGVENYHNPVAIGGALLGFAGVNALASWLKKRFVRPKAEAIETEMGEQ